MPDLCFLGILLAVVTVVGHVIWLVLAALLRAMTGESHGAASYNPQACAACGHPHGVLHGRCRFCGAPVQAAPPPSLKNDLYATARQIDRLRNSGAIDAELQEKLLQLLREEHSRLVGTAPPYPPAAAPPVATSSESRPPPPVVAELVRVPGVEPPAAAELVRVPEDKPPAVVTSPEPDRPTRTLADVLQSFMQEKNIRWGELISGMLIVGCAVGLVVSLRATLRDTIPYFPGLLFMLVTAAIHGAGNYTLRRWNLASTSRGVLIIGTLLVPLNFLAAIIFSGQEEKQIAASDPVFLVAVLVGLLSYGTMTYFASRALQRTGWWQLTLAVMGPSAGQLLINRLVWPEMSTWHVTALMALPLACFMVAMLAQLVRAAQSRELSPRRAEQIFLLLGVATFSLLAPLALLLSKTHEAGLPWMRAIGDTLAQLSPALSLAAAVLLGTGLFVQNRSLRPRLATIRTAGTTLAIFGAVLLLILVALAWPQPEKLIAVGLVNAAVLIALAVVAELPVLHLGAAACLALAYLVGFHVSQRSFEGYDDSLGLRLVQLLVLGKSCVALTFFTALLAGVGAGLLRFSRPADGKQYILAAAATGAVCIAATLAVAFWPAADWPGRESSLATPLLFVYAIGLLAVGLFVQLPAALRATASCAGSLLLWSALVHALHGNVWIHDALVYFQFVPERPVLDATLIHAVLGIGLALWATLRKPNDEDLWEGLAVPVSLMALLSSVAAAPFVFWVKGEAYGMSAAQAAVIATVWLTAAWLHRAPPLALAFQAMAVAAVDLALLSIGRLNGWWDGTPFDLAFLPAHFVVLALWCGAWSGIRRALGKTTRLAALFDTPWPAVDQLVLAVLVRAIVVFAAFGCWPGIVAELGMTSQAALWTGRRSHELAYAGPVWIALGAVYLALVAALWERLSRRGLAGLLVASAAIPFLISGRFEEQQAVASAVRWMFALYSALAATAICSRTALADVGRRLALRGVERFSPTDPPRLRILALALGGMPVLILTGWTFLRVAAGESVGEPVATSFFGVLGPSVSFTVPLFVCTATLLAYALRERSSGFALGGSILFQATLSLACVLRAILAHETFDLRFAAEFLQWNALGLAGYSLLWLALRKLIERPQSVGQAASLPAEAGSFGHVTSLPSEAGSFGHAAWRPEVSPLQVQLSALLSVLVALSLLAGLAVTLWPGESSLVAEQLGSWPSYAAWVAGGLALIWMFRRELERLGVYFVLGGASGMFALVAASLHRFDTTQNWLSLHVLGGSWLGVAIAATTAAGFLRTRTRFEAPTNRRFFQYGSADLAAWATVLGVVVVALATRGLGGDPTSWWSALLVGAAAAVALALSLIGRSQPYALASVVAAATAATYLWLPGMLTRTVPLDLVVLLEWNLLAVLAPAGAVLAAEIWCQKRSGTSFDTRFGTAAVHHGVAIGVTGLMLALVGGGLGLTSLLRNVGWAEEYDASTVESLLILAGLGLLLFAALWDRAARYAVPALYAWGIGLAAFLLDQWEDAPLFGPLLVEPELRPAFTLLAVGLAAALYVTLTGRLWHSGLYLARWGNRLGVPQTVSGLQRISHWLPAASLALAGLAVVIEFGVVLSFEERWMRIMAGFAPAAAAVGIASLAQEGRRTTLQLVALLFAGGSVVLLGWADMPPGWHESIVLERAIRLVMALASLTFLLGVIVVRLVQASEDWKLSARRAAGIYGAASLAALLLVLGLETAFFVPGVGAPLAVSQTLAVAVVLAGLIAGLLSLALLPGRDPLTLTEEGRMFYVYGAQAVAVLLFAHLYLANPLLFDRGLRAYWPYIVVGISFFGVGAGELFKRAGLRVLAEPFQNTGAFLPLLPVIGIWMVAAEHTQYWVLLLTVGLLYSLLAMVKKSAASGIAAAVAGNAALWALLDERHFSILANPQLWAIPPALSVLAAAQLNRRRLGEEALTGVRYACMLVIYASSTAEIFIRGADTSLWPPMILAALSVAGVLAGIGLKIRAFLYLGSSFLLLSILSMVWNAARNIGHIWPWFVFGIGLGIAILILFGIFEKKRREIGLLIDRMRQWER